MQHALAMRILLIGVLFATGCATETSGDDAVSGGGDGKADGTTPGVLAAKYGMNLTSTMKLEDRRETDPAKRFSTITLRARGVVSTTTTDDGVKLSAKLCDITLPTVNGYQPELDPAFVSSLPPIELAGAITDNTLVTETAALVLGARLADPLTSPLPAATSTRLVDQDHDGNPGVSIEVRGYGKIYTSMRVKLDLEVPLTGAPTVTGEATIGLDRSIYGDDIWFYDAASAAAESEQFVKLLSSTNVVKLRSGTGTCAGVRSAFP